MPCLRPRSFLSRLLAVVLILSSAAVMARTPYVPPELNEWAEWVLHNHEEVNCPLTNQMPRACVWPGRLVLSVNSDGAQFSQPVTVYAESWVFLPGRQDTWPQDVSIDGRPAAVSERGGHPALRLAAGRYRIEGRFEWSHPPETLSLSRGTGLVALKIDGRSVPRPRWSDDLLWIADAAQRLAEPLQNQLVVSVYRTITDGAPAYMDLTMQIDISGDSREELIGRLVPEGFTAADMVAPLPARLDDDGQLRIQARPGSWQFSFRARAPGPLSELTFAPQGEHWPREEIWSFAANTAVRVVEATSATPVDPVQAGVPASARQLPSFRMEPGDSLLLVERQRGPSERENDRLTLTRKLWLDFDRAGFTAQDLISGVMVKDWRLDLAPPFALQSANITAPGRDPENLLVTENPHDKTLHGVEIRTPRIQLATLSRLENDHSTLPVSGWQKRFDRVSTDLYLPPGYRLLHAAGAETDADSWLSQWNLLHFFLVLVVAAALWRMYTPWLGGVALLALGLSIHEAGAPTWAWLNLVIAFALVKYLPTGRALNIARTYKLLGIATIVLIALPFAANQLRLAIYPQIDATAAWRMAGVARYRDTSLDKRVTSEEPMEERVQRRALMTSADIAPEAAPAGLDFVRPTGSEVLNRYAKNARVQTGPGVPNWAWGHYRLGWSGPVIASQTTRLWVAPPWLMSVWRVLMTGLIFGVLAALVRRDPVGAPQRRTAASAALAVLALAGVLQPASAPQVYAQTPHPALLEELRKRLIKAPECAPVCVSIARASVRFDDESLSIDLIAHAQTDTTVGVPGTTGGWRPESVRVDGRPVDSLRRTDSGYQLRLDAGVHRVSLVGQLPNVSAASVAFPLVPYHVRVSGQGWEVTGIKDNRLTGGALTLIRQRTDEQRSTLDAIDVEQFPAFVSVDRALNFDLDWEVVTTINRLTPRTSAINLTIPLLDGESVISDNVEVDDGAAIVNLATGQAQIVWRSTLSRVSELTLRAPKNRPWQESWRVVTGASWRLEHAGVPQTIVDRSQSPSWQLHFIPWPGETLALSIRRPTAIDGPTMAIDSARVTQTVGQRSTVSDLEFRYRATRGTQHPITLPTGSELMQVTADGRSLNLAMEDSTLRLPVTPGAHTYRIEWRKDSGQRLYVAGDRPDLGLPVSNIRTDIHLPANRWTLWTRGPTLGPAVLYWSELPVFVLLALVLGRIAKTPLRARHWLLLGLGFSTFFWPAFAIVAAAFLALSWRDRHSIEKPLRFNLVQVGLAGLVVSAGIALITTIPFGLLGSPDMHVRGNHSQATVLRWFSDKSEGLFPATGVVSLPVWVYKGLILIWALWLAFAILRWLPWMWQAFSRDGYWKRSRPLLETTPSHAVPESTE